MNTLAAKRPVTLERVGAFVRSAPVEIVLGICGLTLMAQIAIPLPFTPVPVSMGTLGAMLLGIFLGPRRGTVAAVAYGIGGAMGLPVFAGFNSGFMLTSFGYVLGYCTAAALVGYWVHRPGRRSFLGGLGIALVSSALVYVFGLAWMIVVFDVSLPTALTLGLVPFLLGDLLKSLVIAGAIKATS